MKKHKKLNMKNSSSCNVHSAPNLLVQEKRVERVTSASLAWDRVGATRPEEVRGGPARCSLSPPASWVREGSLLVVKVIFHTSGYFPTGTTAAPEILL